MRVGAGGTMIKEKHLQNFRALVLKVEIFLPFSTKRRLAMSEDVFGCHNFGGRALLVCK